MAETATIHINSDSFFPSLQALREADTQNQYKGLTCLDEGGILFFKKESAKNICRVLGSKSNFDGKALLDRGYRAYHQFGDALRNSDYEEMATIALAELSGRNWAEIRLGLANLESSYHTSSRKVKAFESIRDLAFALDQVKERVFTLARVAMPVEPSALSAICSYETELHNETTPLEGKQYQRWRDGYAFSYVRQEEALKSAGETLSLEFIERGHEFEGEVEALKEFALSEGIYLKGDFLGRGGAGIVVKAGIDPHYPLYENISTHPIVVKILDQELLRHMADPTAEVHRQYSDGLLFSLEDLPDSFLKHVGIIIKHEGKFKLLTEKDRYAIQRGRFEGAPIYAIISEEVQGAQNIDRYVASLPNSAKVSLIKNLLRSLNYLHQKKIIHGDINGGNVLVDDSGNLKVIDYNRIHRLPLRPRCDIGTFGWLPPEVVLRERSSSIGTGVDVWATGCLLLQCLTGIHPFLREGALDTDRALMEFSRKYERAESLDDFRLLFIELLLEAYDDQVGSDREGFITSLDSLLTDEKIDLLSKLFHPDPRKRISAAEAIKHPGLQS